MTNISPIVIKIGGAILTRTGALLKLAETLKTLKHEYPSLPVVLVHGGGVTVDEMLNQAGFVTEKQNGARITPQEHMPIITGALAGHVNKTVVSQFHQSGLNAVGISLFDGGMTRCELNPLNIGHVGVPEAQDSTLLKVLLASGFLPVISSIGCLDNGELVNLNADDAAVEVCKLLDGELLLLTDVNGVMDGNGQFLSSLTETDALQLISNGVISGGMTIKITAAFQAANQLRRTIAVASWESPEQILTLLSGQTIGTRIIPSQHG